VNSSIGTSLYTERRKDRWAAEQSNADRGKDASTERISHLADEIDYIRTRAAEHEGRRVSVGPLVLFSTETGDAWLLDPADHLAARLARDGDPEDVYFQETEATFAIGWKGNYQIDGDAFVYIDRDTARVTTILGYPTRRLAPSA
jgi:hypothetical protein